MGVRGAVAAAACLAPLGACSLLLPFGDLDSANADGGSASADGGSVDAVPPDALTHGDASSRGDGDSAEAAPDSGAADGPNPETCTASSLLTDPNNCGTCGRICCGIVCIDGGCLPGVPRTLEAPSNAPYAIAVDPDGTAVYWSHVDGDAGSAIVRMEKATLATRKIVGHLGDVNAIAAGPTDVYVVDNGSGAVGLVPKDGGAFVPIHTGEINPRGIAVDSSHVWWTEAGYGSAGSNNGNVRRAGLDGSNPQVAYSGRVGPDGIAVSGDTLVWTEFESNDVAVGSTAGGSAPTTTFPNENRARAIVADGPNVFFTDYTYSVVRRFVLGGSPQTIDTTPQNTGADGIALDANFVYWVARSAAGSLWATPRDGQPHTSLAQNLLCPTQVAVDDACVYWIEEGACDYPTDSRVDAGTGRVMRIDKPR
jgi:hypothetical protein